MAIFRKYAVVVILPVVLIVTAGWGFLVHKTVHQLAVYELPKEMIPFFYQNLDYLVTNAPRPDMRRNQDSTEATKHFIDLEMYGDDAVNKMPMDWQAAIKLYTKDSLLKYGYVPYHIIYMKGKLTEAFQKGNKDSILFYAADLGHYIGDANVPLHTSVNYDGQLTNQKGLHSLWESMIPEIEIGSYNLYSSHKAVYLKDPSIAIWVAVRRAAGLVSEMLFQEQEVSKNFTPEQKFRTQMRNGRESKSYTSAFAKAYAA
ncbi:MAG: zinc dependent phospholipase C family protein, partial [Sediminibacterium sp.]